MSSTINLTDHNPLGTFEVKISLKEGARAPERQTEGSAGYDLYSHLEQPVIILPGHQELVSTGVRIQMPSSLEAQIRPRSSTNMRLIDIKFGTIDSDYRGEIKVYVHNESPDEIAIENGMRIAQMIFSFVPRVTFAPTAELDTSVRGEKGFGSTGF